MTWLRAAVGRLRGADSHNGVRLWPLAVLAAVVVLLAVIGWLPRWPGLVHLVALPPLDLFGDLRLLTTEAVSLPIFLVLLTVVWVVRVGVLSLLLGGLTADRLWLAARFYLLLTPVMLALALLDFAAYAVLYSRLFWPVVATVAGLCLLLAPVPWLARAEDGPGRLRTGLMRNLRQGLRLPVLLPYGLVLVLLGALADAAGEAATVALVPVSALATAVAVRFLAEPASGLAGRRLAAVVAVVGVLVAAGFVTTRTVAPAPPAPPRAGSLLLMSGINSSSGNGAIFETEVAALGFDCGQTYYFSYAGPGDGAPQGAAHCPIRTGAPYDQSDTLRPLAEQVESFAAQVRELPEPVTVVGHSLGAWVVWHAVATGAAPQVDQVVLLGPFPDSPVGYPPAGQDGPGRVAGDALRAMAPLVREAGFHFVPDAPAARELLAQPDRATALYARPLPPEVSALSLPSSADLPLMPGGRRLADAQDGCPIREAHPDLPVTPAFYREVNRFLDGEPPGRCPPWPDWGAAAARPFGPPAARY